MVATDLLGKSVFLRELLPQDLKIEIETLTREGAVTAHRLAASAANGSRNADERCHEYVTESESYCGCEPEALPRIVAVFDMGETAIGATGCSR